MHLCGHCWYDVAVVLMLVKDYALTAWRFLRWH